MQPIKIAVIHDDINAPVEACTIREFTNKEEYDAFLKTCEINRDKYFERQNAIKTELERKEREVKEMNAKVLKVLAYLVYERNIDNGDLVMEADDDLLLGKILSNDPSLPKPYLDILKLLKGDK